MRDIATRACPSCVLIEVRKPGIPDFRSTRREGQMRIRAPKDFWSGVMFCGFATVAILAARGYSLGSAGKMGPGYFPLLLGGVLAGLGAILIVRSIAVDGA